MSPLPPRAALLGLPLLLQWLIGCCGCQGPTYSFQVAVRNQTAGPITAWLTKDGPPAEEKWLSPEQLAAGTYTADTPIPAVVIEPGRARATPPTPGMFPRGVHPVLRIYRGQLKLGQILATSRGDEASRLDLVLQHVGLNEFVVRDADGKLSADPSQWPSTGPAPK